MGDFKVRAIENNEARKRMYRHAIADIEVFEKMLLDGVFDQGPLHIGAEQELCIVNANQEPFPKALEILDKVKDPHYTNELALFNLEINLDPYKLETDCFSAMEEDLIRLLDLGKRAAESLEGKILMSGILPSLQFRHLQFDFMTPIERYRTISNTLYQMRGHNFEVHLQGVDEIMFSLNSVLFEACNTSFQLHLQVRSEDFVAQHNWSQMIAGPVLAACVNSPLLFGNELWSETRIALFKQSLDTRTSDKFLRKKLPRVYFGDDWLKESAAELWKKDITRFPLIVTSDELSDARAIYQKGHIPDLRAIRLHNGTTYTWNRLCYGHTETQPHLRIECRYLPAGPTTVDEIANFVLWVGLMRAPIPQGDRFWKNVNFKEVKGNFIKAARTGLNSVFHWYGRAIPARDLLIEQLIPLARQGLKDSNIAPTDIDRYMHIMEERVKMNRTGASWVINNYRHLLKQKSESLAIKEIISASLGYQNSNTPLYQWKDFSFDHTTFTHQRTKIEDIMTQDIYSTNPNSSLEMAHSILRWGKIHHLPVEDDKGDLVGLITDGMMERWVASESEEELWVKDIMIPNPSSVDAHDNIYDVRAKMYSENLSGLPVTFGNKLVGIVTLKDFDFMK